MDNKKKDISWTKAEFSIVVFATILLLISAPDSFASRQYTTETVESEFKQGESITIRDQETIKVFRQLLRFSIMKDGEKVYIRDMSSDEFISVITGDCDVIGITKVCVDSGSALSIGARLYTLIPDMEIEQYIQKEKIIVGEENSMRITIENTGTLTCDDCIYTEKIDPAIEILHVTGADLKEEENMIYWNGTIKGEKTKTIEYDFRALDSKIFNTTSNVTYFNYIQWLEMNAKAEIFIDSWLNISTDHRPEKVLLDHDTVISVNVTNILAYKGDKGNISIESFRIKVPEDVRLTDLPKAIFGYDKNKEEYVWGGKLKENKTKEFWLEIVPKKIGTIEIPYEMTYSKEHGNQSYSLKRTILLDVKTTDVEVTSELDASPRLNASQNHIFEVEIKNKDKNVDFSDVRLRAWNEHFSEEADIGMLKRSSYKTLEVTLPLPSVKEEKEIPVNIFLEYSTASGERFNSTITETVMAIPFDEVRLWHNFTLINSTEQDDLYEVEINVEKLTPFPLLNLTLDETVPENSFVRGKILASLEKLDEPGKHTLHTYHLRIPVEDRNKTTTTEVKSSLGYMAGDVMREKEFSDDLVIEPQEFEEENVIVKDLSLPIIMLFVLSVILIGGSAVAGTRLLREKKEFGIPGINSIKKKEESIQKRKKDIEQEEDSVRREQSNIDTKIKALTDFLDKTKADIKKNTPVAEERKSSLEKRKEEFMRQKKQIDEKIKELQEEEDRLMEKYNSLEREKRAITEEENSLNQKYSNMKAKLEKLKQDFEGLIDKENGLEKAKTQLNNEEIDLMKNKEKLLEFGSAKIVTEKEDVVNEKILLEHEKNRIEEELSSLKARKGKIEDEQKTLDKQKSDLKSEKNLFDTDKKTVDKSLDFLKKENDKLKEILNDMSFR